MEYFMLGVAFLVIAAVVKAYTMKRDQDANPEAGTKEAPTKDVAIYKEAYKPATYLTANEMQAYRKLRPIMDKLSLNIAPKVRLLDLVTPRGGKYYKPNLYKIQAKHVDFAVFDDGLTPKVIIELDDSSHDRADRQERDKFVDYILECNGYKIYHMRSINTEQLTVDLARDFNIKLPEPKPEPNLEI